MSPRTDHDDGLPDTPDPFALAAHLGARYRKEIAFRRDILARRAMGRPFSTAHQNSSVRDRPVEGPSLFDPGLNIHLSPGDQLASDLGSVPPGVRVTAVSVHVQAFTAEFPTRDAAGPHLVDAISELEGDVWARALLGDQWADHSYALASPTDPPPRWVRPFHTAQRVYVVLLDQNAEPLLAPDNFDFTRLWIWVGSVRKIPPRDPALAAKTDRDGPYVDTDAIRDPLTEKDGGWRIDVTGLDPAQLTPLAGETARRLMQRIRIRGAIDTRCRPLRVHVGTSVLWVYLQWEGDPETYVLTLSPPQKDSDLGGPPEDSPGAIVGTMLLAWMEELHTGLRTRGHRRRTADGAVHLMGPIADD